MATGATHKCCCPPPSNQSLGYMTTPSSQKEGKYKVWIDMKAESHSAVWEDGTPTPPPSLGLVMAAIIIPVCVCVGNLFTIPSYPTENTGFLYEAFASCHVFGSIVVERGGHTRGTGSLKGRSGILSSSI